MTNPAKIEDIMHFLDAEESNTKLASAAPVQAPAANDAPLQSALADVMASLGQTKTAAVAPAAAPVASAPVNDLVKMANEIAAIDRDGEIKHAQLVGAAMADAFVARINQWDQASGSDKTASDETAQLEKFAAENPAAYQQAVSQGYTDAKALIEKIGNDIYLRSYEAERANIEKEASEHFVHGWNAIAQADRSLASGQ